MEVKNNIVHDIFGAKNLDITQIPTRANELFCFGVYTASHAINRAYSPHLKRLGVTYPQYITLTLLWERDGQNINELAQQLGMETSTMTPLIKRLETMGYVTRTRSQSDGRAIDVTLTDQGASLGNEAPGITACMIEDTGLDQAELLRLQDLLLRLRDGLQSA